MTNPANQNYLPAKIVRPFSIPDHIFQAFRSECAKEGKNFATKLSEILTERYGR